MTLDSIWHYTDGRGLEGIVTHDTLRATSFRHLNDSREADYATSLLKDAAKKRRTTVPTAHQARFDSLMKHAERRGLDLFLLCAARKPDLLTVWRGYGGKVSYAIELDATVDLLPIQRTDATEHPNPPAGWEFERDEEGSIIVNPDQVHIEVVPWRKVRYNTAGVDARVDRIAKLAEKKKNPISDLFFPWHELADIKMLELKHPAFKDEREARMILEVNPRWKFVHHYEGRFGVTPFIELSAVNEDNQHNANNRYLTAAGKLPIRSVMIGPTPLGDEVIDATKEFLELNGYPDVDVSRSTIPFRS
jgi:hypothetical protein